MQLEDDKVDGKLAGLQAQKVTTMKEWADRNVVKVKNSKRKF